MSALDLRTIALALGGEVSGRQVLAPGPNHGRLDRSLSVRLSPQSPTGFICHSFAGDPFDLCRDFVMQRLGLPLDTWRTKGHSSGRTAPVFAVIDGGERIDHAARIARARAIWEAAADPHGTAVERYLAGRGLNLPAGADAIRFNPRTPWREDSGELVRVPAMVAAMRSIHTDVLTALHKTRLSVEGTKLGRKMQGIAGGSAIKLDAADAVTMGLAIAEGIETALQGRQLGFRPAWALGSAGAVAAFPVVAGIEALTIHAERDDTNARAVEMCARRWHAAGREVVLIEPKTGNDLNDAVRGRAS